MKITMGDVKTVRDVKPGQVFRLNGEYWLRATNPNHRSEEHTSELQSPCNLVCRLLLEKKKNHEVSELRKNQEITQSIVDMKKFSIKSKRQRNPVRQRQVMAKGKRTQDSIQTIRFVQLIR